MDQGLRSRMRGGERLLGAFVKTPAPPIPELLARGGMDFAVIDAEHAPFDLQALEIALLGGRAGRLACLVRTPEASSTLIGQVLDLGAAGILAAHVRSEASARSVIAAAKFSSLSRGFSPSTRCLGFGAGTSSVARREADDESLIVCQIEDQDALEHLEAIAGLEAVDCLFVGRADLALSLGAETASDPRVTRAVAAVAEAARSAKTAAGIFITDPREAAELAPLGYTVFVCGSDQSFVLSEARRIRGVFSALVGD